MQNNPLIEFHYPAGKYNDEQKLAMSDLVTNFQKENKTAEHINLVLAHKYPGVWIKIIAVENDEEAEKIMTEGLIKNIMGRYNNNN